MKILRVKADVEAIFKKRLNKFLGIVEIEGIEEKVHIHDPGRLEELLYSGNKVLLKNATNPLRKTKRDIVAAQNNDKWVFVHSGYHGKIAYNILKSDISPFGKLDEIIPEVNFDGTRIDFLLKKDDRRIAVEVKGCTLSQNNVALFPDAPTLRGTRHLQKLIELLNKGFECAVIILIFREESKYFIPNEKMDKNFADIFWEAVKRGVKVFPILLRYDGENIFYLGRINLKGG